MKSIVPRFALNQISHERMEVSQLQLAATIYAFDVPLHKERPFTTQAGDGVQGVKVVWNFHQTDPAGNNPKALSGKWADESWMVVNPTHPLAVTKRAFCEYYSLLSACREGFGYSVWNGPAVRITNTRKAAVIRALGHPITGWQRNDAVTTWCFHEAAATDAVIYDRLDLYQTLPDAPISYAKAALLSHEAMIAASKQVQLARVEHRGRVAMIGTQSTQSQINSIEKLLYRK